MRIAMVSEHASPLAALGGPDAGGQNVYVARLAEELTRRGHQVTVYTRRDAATLPERVPLPGGAVVEHVTAGPAEPIPKDELLAHMPAFGAHLARAWARERDRPEVVHAHFWMSGIAARLGAHPHGIPVVQTFHALGTVKRRHQGAADTSPPERIGVERGLGRTCDRVLATCSDEVRELAAMGVPRRRVAVVPCGVDADHFRPDPGRVLSGGTASGGAWRPPERRAAHRLLAIGRLVPRKGYDQAVRALPRIPDTELLLAGGPRNTGSPRTRRPGGCSGSPENSASPTGCGCSARSTRHGCRTSCAPPTWCCAPPPTSPSASCRWRRWRAASRSSPPTSAATATASPTGSPAARPARRPRRRRRGRPGTPRRHRAAPPLRRRRPRPGPRPLHLAAGRPRRGTGVPPGRGGPGAAHGGGVRRGPRTAGARSPARRRAHRPQTPLAEEKAR